MLQALVYPATDHGCEWPSYRQYTTGPAFHTADMQWYWEQFLDDPTRAGEPDCSPLRAPDLSGLAPALVLTAEHDPLRDEGEEYGARLRAAGVVCTVNRYAGAPHGFVQHFSWIPEFQRVFDETGEFVRSAVRAGAV